MQKYTKLEVGEREVSGDNDDLFCKLVRKEVSLVKYLP
jgi:hypothetical protein